jgi:peptide/nickel transport system permease protein
VASPTPAGGSLLTAQRGRPRLLRFRQRNLIIGGGLILAVVLIALFAPLIAPYGPQATDYDARLRPPSRDHLLGTDNLGKDLLSRIIYGARIDLQVGVISVLLPFVIGTVLGCLAGYYGGWVDTVVMRIVDVVVAFPFIVLVIGIVAMLGPGLRNLFIGIGLVGWVAYARLVRGEILVAKNQEYVLAAKTLGNGSARIIGRHILPNVIAPAVVFAMSDAVLNILLGAALSFLGLGVQPPTPEWGSMIQEARNFIRQAWWMPTFPGLAIIVTGIAFSVLGDGLAERLQTGR